MNISSLVDIRKMCWPAYLYFFTYIITFAISASYYAMHKKTLCTTQKIDNESIDTCIVNCTTFNYFYNIIHVLLLTFVLNLFCKYGSIIGWIIAFIIYLFTLTPLLYFIKIIMDKDAKQKDLKC